MEIDIVYEPNPAPPIHSVTLVLSEEEARDLQALMALDFDDVLTMIVEHHGRIVTSNLGYIMGRLRRELPSAGAPSAEI